jgi:hypothetical protein
MFFFSNVGAPLGSSCPVPPVERACVVEFFFFLSVFWFFFFFLLDVPPRPNQLAFLHVPYLPCVNVLSVNNRHDTVLTSGPEHLQSFPSIPETEPSSSMFLLPYPLSLYSATLFLFYFSPFKNKIKQTSR